MALFWNDELPKGKPFRPNPRPPVPNTGWKPATDFPDLSSAKAISFDVETYDPEIEEFGSGWARGKGHIIGVALATDDGFKKYFPIRHESGFNHNIDICGYFREQLSRPNQAKVAHKAIYDVGWLEFEGIPIVGKLQDSWTAEKLLNHSSSASLEELGQRYLGEGKESTELYKWAWEYWGNGIAKNASEMRKLSMKNLYQTPSELAGFYAESDVDLPLRIFPQQFEKMGKLGLLDVYRLECDLIGLLVQMRLKGVQVDLDRADEAHKAFGLAIDELQKEIDEIAGKHINTGSALEIAPVFDKLKIKYPRTEKTDKPSFKGEFLKTVEHPLAAKIVEIEDLKKMQSTFIKGQILEANVDSKVFCTFNPLCSVTGRMSCSSPNLQQTPSRGNLAKTVKNCFVPDRGHVEWRDYDFSSIESRILAHFAVGQGARELRKEYNDDPFTDYHSFTQKMIKNLVGLELNRKHVKNVNFAGIYGASEKKLQRMMGLTDAEATTFFDAYHTGLPYVRETMKHVSHGASQCGFTTTIMGRRAMFDKWEPKFNKERLMPLEYSQALRVYGPNIQRAYLHKALNYLIQGSAADLMKKVMVQCWQEGIFDVIGVPRLVIHDALEFSVEENTPEIENGFKEMRRIMENALKFKIPVKVEGHKGPSWGSVDELIVDE